MPRVSPIHITKQPNNDDILNSFGIMGNELFLYEWTFQKKTCGYITTYHTTLSDVRLLLRWERKGCWTRNRTDVSIILRDIGEIRESSETRDCCCPLCTCCVRCCRTPKFLEVRGTFGSHKFMIPKEDVVLLQYEISVAIGNYKLVSH